jgi:hypothetical protein
MWHGRQQSDAARIAIFVISNDVPPPPSAHVAVDRRTMDASAVTIVVVVVAIVVVIVDVVIDVVVDVANTVAGASSPRRRRRRRARRGGAGGGPVVNGRG